MKIVAAIEARMTSSRLPGKVLMPVAGTTMLGYLIRGGRFAIDSLRRRNRQADHYVNGHG